MEQYDTIGPLWMEGIDHKLQVTQSITIRDGEEKCHRQLNCEKSNNCGKCSGGTHSSAGITQASRPILAINR